MDVQSVITKDWLDIALGKPRGAEEIARKWREIRLPASDTYRYVLHSVITSFSDWTSKLKPESGKLLRSAKSSKDTGTNLVPYRIKFGACL